MDIAALASTMSQINVKQEASLRITKMAMDTVEMKAENVLSLLEESPRADLIDATPNLGKNIDVSV